MPFLRVTRDERGYENTFLLHEAAPGGRARILYWYRSAPGVRVGRSALDEDAIRVIEERNPDIEFDWPHILEAATMLPPEIERRPDQKRRRPPRPRDEATPAHGEDAEPQPSEPALEANAQPAEEPADTPEPRETDRRDTLEELVGREISTRLRARYAEISSRIAVAADEALRDAWRARAEALNPDRWLTPEEILRGVQHADTRFDELRREIAKTELG